MSFINFDKNLLPRPFGLANTGVICYWNSLLQALLSCTSLTEIFLKNRNNPRFINNHVSRLYLDIIDATTRGETLKYNSHIQLWQAVIRQSDNITFGRGQEDATEGFILLMKCWEKIPEITSLFDIIHHSNCYCFICNRKKFSREEITGKNYAQCKYNWDNNIPIRDVGWIHFNNHFIIPVEQSMDVEQLILKKISKMDDDYRCFNCEKTGRKIQTMNLISISEILVVVFKKYNYDKFKKRNEKLDVKIAIPNSLRFDMASGKKKAYYAVSTLIHDGSPYNAHYTSKSIRSANGNLSWYLLNDMHFHPTGKEFDKNTYVVFYHCL